MERPSLPVHDPSIAGTMAPIVPPSQSMVLVISAIPPKRLAKIQTQNLKIRGGSEDKISLSFHLLQRVRRLGRTVAVGARFWCAVISRSMQNGTSACGFAFRWIGFAQQALNFHPFTTLLFWIVRPKAAEFRGRLVGALGGLNWQDVLTRANRGILKVTVDGFLQTTRIVFAWHRRIAALIARNTLGIVGPKDLVEVNVCGRLRGGRYCVLSGLLNYGRSGLVNSRQHLSYRGVERTDRTHCSYRRLCWLRYLSLRGGDHWERLWMVNLSAGWHLCQRKTGCGQQYRFYLHLLCP